MADTTKRIIYNNPTTGIAAIIIPAPKSPRTLDEIIAQSVPSGVQHSIVNVEDVPTDRTFRSAWKYTH
tara:strand:- start:79 stop:282 length:204 start_codon:yes stop_codon:yes gene_type:complete